MDERLIYTRNIFGYVETQPVLHRRRNRRAVYTQLTVVDDFWQSAGFTTASVRYRITVKGYHARQVAQWVRPGHWVRVEGYVLDEAAQGHTLRVVEEAHLTFPHPRLGWRAEVAVPPLEALNHGHIPQPDTVRTLAGACGEEVDAAMEAAGYIRLPTITEATPEEARTLLHRLYRLEEGERQFVLALLGHALHFLEARSEA